MANIGSFWGIGPWGETPWGIAIPDQVQEFATVVATVFAADVIKLEFPELMKNNAVLQNPATYTVIPIGNGIPVEVKEVKTGNDGRVTEIYLIVTPFTIGEEYVINILSSLLTIEGNILTIGADASFIGRNTKIDRMVKSRPAMYDMNSGSLLRVILEAIGNSDELIGGSH